MSMGINPGNEITCVLNQYTSGKGRQVTELMRKNGDRITEVVTDLGDGEKGTRRIYHNEQKVVDDLYDRHEEYCPYGEGVMQTADGLPSYLPNVKFSKLTEID